MRLLKHRAIFKVFYERCVPVPDIEDSLFIIAGNEDFFVKHNLNKQAKHTGIVALQHSLLQNLSQARNF
jgi:hypothetical protein